MFHIILFEPEIPPNTGNIIRLCANTGSTLHLIHPLGFKIDDKSLRRAGLDYHEHVSLRQHDDFDAFFERVQPKRLFAIETGSSKCYATVQFQPQDAFLFGSETRGLPQALLNRFSKTHLSLPMQPQIRSLNLSNTVAIVLYEAWRQNHFTCKKH